LISCTIGGYCRQSSQPLGIAFDRLGLLGHLSSEKLSLNEQQITSQGITE